MVLIDNREGSALMASHITGSVLCRLEYGDAMIIGNGPDGSVQIGVERKTIGDMVNSIDTGRLSGHQIPGLLSQYYHSYIIVEGMWTEGVSGELLLRKGKSWKPISYGSRKYTAEGVWSYITSVEYQTGIDFRMSVSLKQTCRMIEQLDHWWGKEWDQHHSILAMHKPGPPSANLLPPSLLRRIVAELPGVGWKRSIDVEKYFGSIPVMLAASVKEWKKVPGVGKVVANAVWEVLHGKGE